MLGAVYVGKVLAVVVEALGDCSAVVSNLGAGMAGTCCCNAHCTHFQFRSVCVASPSLNTPVHLYCPQRVQVCSPEKIVFSGHVTPCCERVLRRRSSIERGRRFMKESDCHSTMGTSMLTDKSGSMV